MPKATLPAPVDGVTDASTFIGQPPSATVPEGLVNYWPEEVGTGRQRLTTRDKLAAIYSGAQGTGPVQELTVVAQASAVSGVDVGPETVNSNGSNRNAGAIRCNVLFLDSDWTVLGCVSDTRGDGAGITPPPGTAFGYGGFCVCFDQDNPNVAFYSMIVQDTPQTTQAVLCTLLGRVDIDADPETRTHAGACYDCAPTASFPLPSIGQEEIVVNFMRAKAPYLFSVCNRYIYVHRASDLAYLQRLQVDFAIESQCVRIITVNGADYLVVGTTGSVVISGPVVADAGPAPLEAYGEFYRASPAVVYRINYADAALRTPVAVNGTPLTRIAMPQGTQGGDPGYEDHRTFRPSEYGSARPRGCLIYSMDLEVDGSDVFVYFARTNQGFGYNGATSGQGLDGPYFTIAKANITAAFASTPVAYLSPTTGADYGIRSGVGGWEIDTNSYRRGFGWHGATYFNDIPGISGTTRPPDSPGRSPSIFAIAYSSGFDIVVGAGARPSASGFTPNVYGVRGVDGVRLWETFVSDFIPQNALAIDPTTGNVVVGARRNDDWGSGGTDAELFELSIETGTVARTFDFTDAIVHNGYITAANEESLVLGCYGVDVNSRGQVVAGLAPFRYDV